MRIDLLAVDLPTIDHHVLAHFRTVLCSGDQAIAEDLTTSYLDNAEVSVEEMEAALHADDSATLWRLAHTLKSSSQMFGALRLAEHCRLLENAQQPSSTHIETIRTELDRVLAFFAAGEQEASATVEDRPPQARRTDTRSGGKPDAEASSTSPSSTGPTPSGVPV